MKDDVLEMAKELQARPELRQPMKEAATASPAVLEELLREMGLKTAGSVPETLRKIIREFDPADRFKYQLLSRLQTDCDYFLGYGHRNPGALWAGNVPDHIAGMRALWESFPEDARPEWLTADDLDRYERDMMDGAEE